MIFMIFDGHKKEALLEQEYFTGSIPLLTTNHSFKKCGGKLAWDGRNDTS